ncbi:hypothetical protein N0V93_006092 [Gnomoniopsis smithogilvyi]|uniref:Uncharacterized protein n=1 Tax=Gnomoniopsis smithogilvyi TaxID=1191159 RepID=A0A9W8YR14_9PEZI|nr:hypothetical protein N0V93_006092 [Gnomoniopsis smithogilvyi]
MPRTQTWEVLVDRHIALAKQCQMSDCGKVLEKLLITPTFDTFKENGDGCVNDGNNIEIRSLYKDTVLAGRKAYDAFHEVIKGFMEDKPEEGAWEERIGTEAVLNQRFPSRGAG